MWNADWENVRLHSHEYLLFFFIKTFFFNHRYAFVTSDSVQKHGGFIADINASCEGGLSCSFTDKEMVQFWQFKKRNTGAVPKKKVVSTIGEQSDNQTWILSKNLYINEDGNQIDSANSPYIWISLMLQGKGIAPNCEAIVIPKMLSTDGLHPLLDALHKVMKQNFPAALVVLGSAGLSMHYKTLVEKNGECPAPFICGGVGTGKSLALRAALSLFGSHKTCFYSRGTREKLLQHLSWSALPIGIDDPQKPDTIGELMVDLFNGAKSTTISHGDIQPITTGIVTANFNLSQKLK